MPAVVAESSPPKEVRALWHQPQPAESGLYYLLFWRPSLIPNLNQAMAAKTRETLLTSEFVLPQTGMTKQNLENAPDVGW